MQTVHDSTDILLGRRTVRSPSSRGRRGNRRLGRRLPRPGVPGGSISWEDGQHDLAFEALEQSYERRQGFVNQFRVDPRMDSLQDDPRFDELVAQMNYP